jgi:hypothetical protein
MKEVFRVKRILGGGLALTALLIVMAMPAGAQAKEQVVFSGEADGTLGEVGFWIWCAVDEAGAYDDCSGALAFDDLGIVRHVEGEVTETGEDVYVMDVSSTRDGSVACTLTNDEPILSGPRNTVEVDCSTPSGMAESSDAVVVVTG